LKVKKGLEVTPMRRLLFCYRSGDRRSCGQANVASLVLALCTLIAAVRPALATRHTRPKPAAQRAAAAAVTYQEACVLEPVTGAVIFARNDHQPWPTASLTKMMLMLIVAEKLDDGSLKLSDRITTSRKAAKMGGSQVYLKEGETFSLDDLMKAVAVHSANDASVAVAEYVAGSTDAFVQMMNERAQKLGMKDTHYYSVHGLPPSPGQQPDVSSAYDEALLARALLTHPQVLKWTSIRTAPFRNGSFELRNTNHLVFTYDGCDGLKTGFYYKAGFNVVATAMRHGMRLVAVVMGSPRKRENFRQAAEFMSEGFANYEMLELAKKGAPSKKTVAVTGGEISSLTPVWAGDATVLIRRGQAKTAFELKYDLPASVAAPVKAGQKIGTAQVFEGGKPAATIALIAPSSVAKRQGLIHRLLGWLF
jgi:serine-type D-Ala-D-Ala carboxypeptidase (penicillin-binding protein 5/6)